MHKKKALELGIKDYEEGYIAVKVSFANIPFTTLIPELSHVLAELKHKCVVLHDLDIAVDCAYISTRLIIERYILGQGVEQANIIKDRHSVGDNCISWCSPVKNNLSMRTKVYNKFVQMLESCDVRSSIGSQLNYLVSNPDTALLERFQSYAATGMSRIEITIYSNKILTTKRYHSIMDDTLSFLKSCPTFKVPFQQQWREVVGRLSQMMAVYIRDTKTFAYCHWWNSITRRKQGIVKPQVNASEVKALLANFGFNDRPIHYFLVERESESAYRVIKQKTYTREKGCTAITLVPGISNSLYPFRAGLLHHALNFKDIGLVTVQNITIEWPQSRLRRDRNVTLANIRRVKSRDVYDMSSLGDALECSAKDSPIVHSDVLRMADYKADYQALEVGAVYTVKSYGYGMYRGREYLCLTLDDGIHVRCSQGLTSILPTPLKDSQPFQIRVVRTKKIKGNRDLECELC